MPDTLGTDASFAAFIAILAAVVGAIAWAVHRVYPTPRALSLVLLFWGAWLGLLAMVVHNGRLYSLPLHGLPLVLGSVILFAVGFGISPLGKKLAHAIPLAALVGFQAFRLPLELVLHSWANEGAIPTTMTWTGQNWDILSGLVALICAPLVERKPAAAHVANLVGIALLLNVMRVVVMSSPLPFAWQQQPPLELAFRLPHAFIGPICLGGALFGHVILTRALLRR